MTKPTQPCADLLYLQQNIVNAVDKAMPGENTLFDLSELFKSFGDSTRLRILFCLLIKEMCVYDIANLLSMSQSAISINSRC